MSTTELTQDAPASSRDRILDVAEELFAQRGYTGVGLREVADAAGLGKSSLFHHFRGKAELYSEVLARGLARVDERVQPAIMLDGSAADRLMKLIDAFIDALVADQPAARLFLRALFEDDSLPPGIESIPEFQAGERTLESLVDATRGLIRDGVKSGEFRRVSAVHTIQTIIGATAYHFASGDFGEQLLGTPLLSPDAVATRRHEVKQMLYHGLIARPDEPAHPQDSRPPHDRDGGTNE